MSHVAIVYYSGRGHTKVLAEAVRHGIRDGNVSAKLINIERFSSKDYQTLREAKGILWGSPTYMGCMAGQFKCFMDELSGRGVWVEQAFRNKLAGGFTVATYPSGDKLNTLMQLAIISAQHGMIWVNHDGVGERVENSLDNPNPCGGWLGLMATSVHDKTQMIERKDRLTAHAFGRRFAWIVTHWTALNIR